MAQSIGAESEAWWAQQRGDRCEQQAHGDTNRGVPAARLESQRNGQQGESEFGINTRFSEFASGTV